MGGWHCPPPLTPFVRPRVNRQTLLNTSVVVVFAEKIEFYTELMLNEV